MGLSIYVFAFLWAIGMGGFCFFLLWCFGVVGFEDKTQPKPKMSTTEPNISEPILSFVQCVKDNPGRFVIIPTVDIDWNFVYKVVDKKTKKVFSATFRKVTYSSVGTVVYTEEAFMCASPEWVTKDEVDYVVEKLKMIYKQRKERLHAIQRARMARDYVS